MCGLNVTLEQCTCVNVCSCTIVLRWHKPTHTNKRNPPSAIRRRRDQPKDAVYALCTLRTMCHPSESPQIHHHTAGTREPPTLHRHRTRIHIQPACHPCTPMPLQRSLSSKSSRRQHTSPTHTHTHAPAHGRGHLNMPTSEHFTQLSQWIVLHVHYSPPTHRTPASPSVFITGHVAPNAELRSTCAEMLPSTCVACRSRRRRRRRSRLCRQSR